MGLYLIDYQVLECFLSLLISFVMCFVRGGNELGIVPSTVIDLQKLGIATPTTPQSAAPNPLLRLMAGTFTPGLRILPGHCVQQMKAATAIATATPSKTHSRVWS